MFIRVSALRHRQCECCQQDHLLVQLLVLLDTETLEYLIHDRNIQVGRLKHQSVNTTEMNPKQIASLLESTNNFTSQVVSTLKARNGLQAAYTTGEARVRLTQKFKTC